MTVAEVLDVVRRDRLFYEDSGGGVTFSGGEPLGQERFLLALLRACNAEGIHCALDTCGHVAQEALLRISSLVDLFLYDIKVFDEAKHQRLTGIPNRVLLANLIKLGEFHKRIWVRVPIIPGCTDGTEDLESIARFVASIPSIQQVNLLPYHRIGTAKRARLVRGLSETSCPPDDRDDRGLALDTPGPSRARMEAVRDRFQAHGLTAIIGG